MVSRLRRAEAAASQLPALKLRACRSMSRSLTSTADPRVKSTKLSSFAQHFAARVSPATNRTTTGPIAQGFVLTVCEPASTLWRSQTVEQRMGCAAAPGWTYSAMVARYGRQAGSAADLDLGWYHLLGEAILELAQADDVDETPQPQKTKLDRILAAETPGPLAEWQTPGI